VLGRDRPRGGGAGLAPLFVAWAADAPPEVAVNPGAVAGAPAGDDDGASTPKAGSENGAAADAAPGTPRRGSTPVRNGRQPARKLRASADAAAAPSRRAPSRWRRRPARFGECSE
jgi:hypothetical protein